MQNWWGSADVSQALKMETQLLEHVALLFATAEIIQTPWPLKYIGLTHHPKHSDTELSCQSALVPVVWGKLFKLMRNRQDYRELYVHLLNLRPIIDLSSLTNTHARTHTHLT